MPAPGEQHNNSSVTNLFEEVKPRMSEYTAQEIATLQSRLEKQLGPEYISSRPGAAGQKVHYLAAEKCINLANEVFGFNGWSSTIKEIQVDESTTTGKISLGLSVIVRVSLRDGSFHEDIGYGHIENCKGKAAAFEKAKKEGTTDALKRALRNFGNVLGNCIYDKEYLSKVTKLKVTPAKLGVDNLHRHVDHAPVKKEPSADTDSLRTSGESRTTEDNIEGDDEFGAADFDEVDFSVGVVGHPDEVSLDASTTTAQPSIVKGSPNIALPRSVATNVPQNRPPVSAPTTARAQAMPSGPMNGLANPLTKPPQQPMAGLSTEKVNALMHRGPISHQQQSHGPPQRQMSHTIPRGPHPNPHPPSGLGFSPGPQRQGPPTGYPIATKGEPPPVGPPNENDPPIGFFTARAAETVQNASAMPPDVPIFNPHLESPSIRKTAGVDHTKTGPVPRDLVAGAPPGNAPMPPRPNFTNLPADQGRRIGMPKPAMASPLQNRGSYKPPQMMKRPADGGSVQYARPVLHDVTTASVNVPPDFGADVKRQRVGNGAGDTSGVNTTAG